MRLTDPSKSAMHELADACENRDTGALLEGLRIGMQDMQNELTKWINEKTVYDLPFVAACLLLCGNGVMATLKPMERAVAEGAMKLLTTVTMKVPGEEVDRE